MNIGQRIKKIRKEKGLSVDYIADKLGKNRATIYRYESNEIENLPYPILVPLAKILGTTPMYLMGIDENIEEIKVTIEEKQLLDNYNKLNDLGKKEANKRVSELTEISKYILDTKKDTLDTKKDTLGTKKDTYEVPITIAAHDDNLTDDEKDEMNRRIEEFEKNLNK